VNANGRRKVAPKIERETFSRINTRRPSVSICVRDRRVRFYPSLGDSRRWRWWRSNGFWRESNANVGGLDISDATFGAFGTRPIILTLAAPQQVVWTDVFSRTVRKRFNRFVRKRLCTHTHTRHVWVVPVWARREPIHTTFVLRSVDTRRFSSLRDVPSSCHTRPPDEFPNIYRPYTTSFMGDIRGPKVNRNAYGRPSVVPSTYILVYARTTETNDF